MRTPVGSFRGALASKSATSLGAIAIKGVIESAGINSSIVEEVYMGNVIGSGLGQAPTKQAVMEAGLSENTICTTINKVCSSGLKAVMLAAQSIELGHQSCIVAGGMESMTNAPYLLDKAREGYGYGNQQITDSILKDGLWDAHYQCHMGDCAEETAAKYSITREEQDAHAIQSYTRSAEAIRKGTFTKEIIPVPIGGGSQKGSSKSANSPPVTLIKEDEEYKKVNFDKIPLLRPVFKSNGGTVTAANSSTLNDGASAVLLMSSERLENINSTMRKDSNSINNKLMGMAQIVAYADSECNPKEFTIAPSLVIPKVLEKANLNIKDISLFEINEAFSVVALVNQKVISYSIYESYQIFLFNFIFNFQFYFRFWDWIPSE